MRSRQYLRDGRPSAELERTAETVVTLGVRIDAHGSVDRGCDVRGGDRVSLGERRMFIGSAVDGAALNSGASQQS